MAKQIQELAMSFFLVATGITLILSLMWVKPVLDSQKMLLDESRKNQAQAMETVGEIRTLAAEILYASAVLGMAESKIIQPAEANKLIGQSVDQISEHSDRYGKLAQAMNNFRMNQRSR